MRDGRGVRVARRCALAGATFGMLASGCAVNPVSGRPEVVLTSTAHEREIGQAEARKLEQQVGFLEPSALVAWVEAVGGRLAAESPRRDVEYHFAVVDMPEPNAFALPGGWIFVSRGLLVLVNSEDELAGVLGHEIAHVAARHAVQRQTAAAPLAIATALPALAAGIVMPGVGRAVAGLGQLASGVVLASYSREQEREADRVGQEMAAAAGWDPGALPAILRTLERDEMLGRGAARQAGFLASHPSAPERMRDAEAYGAGLGPVPHETGDHAVLLARLDGLRVGENPAEGVFIGRRFVHPELGFRLDFPEGWERMNGRAFVVARPPTGDALAVLEALGRADDPALAAPAFEKATGVRLAGDPARLAIGGLEAARSQSEYRDLRLHLTWIVHGGVVYQVMGVAPRGAFGGYTARFAEVAESFAPLGEAERTAVEDSRLHVVTARPGETPAQLVARTGAAWTAEKVAVANALDPGAPLAGGQRVKVAIDEPYADAASVVPG